MAYEIFTKRVTRNNAPAITIGTSGRIGLNKTAAELLSKEAVDHVLLMWDSEHRKIGIRPIRKKDPRAYRVNFSVNKSGAGIAAKAFCDYIGYDYQVSSKKFRAEWNETESAIEIDLNQEEQMRAAPRGFEVHKRGSRSA